MNSTMTEEFAQVSHQAVSHGSNGLHQFEGKTMSASEVLLHSPGLYRTLQEQEAASKERKGRKKDKEAKDKKHKKAKKHKKRRKKSHIISKATSSEPKDLKRDHAEHRAANSKSSSWQKDSGMTAHRSSITPVSSGSLLMAESATTKKPPSDSGKKLPTSTTSAGHRARRPSGRTKGGPDYIDDESTSMQAPALMPPRESPKYAAATRKGLLEERSSRSSGHSYGGFQYTDHGVTCSPAPTRLPRGESTKYAVSREKGRDSEYATARSHSAHKPPAQSQNYTSARRMELENEKMAALSSSYSAQTLPAQSPSYTTLTRKGLFQDERSVLEDDPQVGAVRISGMHGSTGGSVVDEEHYNLGLSPDVEAGSTGGRTHLADAVLVDEVAEERRIAEQLERERQNVPVAYAEKEAPWYKRKSFVAAVIVLVIAVVVTVTAVVVTSQSNDSSPDFPTFSPTFSPAPTAVTVITLALQLDSKPHETGWALECDGETLESVAPGTYALVGLRPNFRVLYETLATIGAECQLTLTDAGNDGLNGGFYEIYYGDDIGQQSARISSGTFLTNSDTFLFNVITPEETGPSPPSLPLPPPTNCTVCPDGSAPGFPDSITDEFGGQTCEEVDRTISQLSFNSEECRLIHDSTGSECGCNDFCTTICPDGVSEPDPANDENVVLVKNNRQLTCSDLHEEIVASKNNSIDECLSANFLGEDVCGCPPIDARCRICQGGVVPPAEDLATEIVPGVTCRDITGIAYTLRKNDPSGIFFQLCPACLAIGVYCGCEQPAIEDGGRKFCRICGENNEDLLPEAGRLLNSTVLNQTTTCFHLELASNVVANSTLPCEEYQRDGAEQCCS